MMNKIILVVISIFSLCGQIFTENVQNIQAVSLHKNQQLEKTIFEKTIAEEKQDVWMYIKQHNPDWTEEDFTEWFFRQSPAGCSELRVTALFILKEMVLESGKSENTHTQKVVMLIQDILDTFNQLKVLMNIPAEVEIFYVEEKYVEDAENSDGTQKDRKSRMLPYAFYSISDRKLYITQNFFSLSLSQQLFCLIHELTHCQQHMQRGFIAMISIDSTVADEHEADTQAIQAISCPLCIQAIQDQASNNPQLKEAGYLSKQDIAVYNNNKSIENVCDTHKADTAENQKFKELLNSETDEDIDQRIHLDFKIGTLSERLSTVKFA